MIITVEGIDGSGKSTLAKGIAEKIGLEYIEKPMKMILDKGNENNYYRVSNQLNNNESALVRTLFYACGNAYVSENYKEVVIDRYILSNYYHNSNCSNLILFDILIKLIKKPDLTFLLWCNNEVRRKRMVERNHRDPDIDVIEEFNDYEFNKMKDFLEANKFNYMVIDTSNLSKEEALNKMFLKIQEEKDKMMPKETKKVIHIPIGIPASGKSTYYKEKEIKIISSDKEREKTYGEEIYSKLLENKVKEGIIEKLIKNIRENNINPIALDTTYFNSVEAREELIRSLKEGLGEEIKNISLIFDLFNTNKEECIRRDRNRLSSRRVGKSVIEALTLKLKMPVARELETYKIDFSINNIIEETNDIVSNRDEVFSEKFNEAEKKTVAYIIEEAKKIKKKYLHKEITGETYGYLVDDQLNYEELYVEDLKSGNSFPVMYYKGIFLNLRYSMVKATNDLKTTIVRIEQVEVF